jgi:hypothetical protein
MDDPFYLQTIIISPFKIIRFNPYLIAFAYFQLNKIIILSPMTQRDFLWVTQTYFQKLEKSVTYILTNIFFTFLLLIKIN